MRLGELTGLGPDPKRSFLLDTSDARDLCVCDRALDEPFLPPGLSVRSRIVVSRSIRPALRRALLAIVLEPGAGVGLENIKCFKLYVL